MKIALSTYSLDRRLQEGSLNQLDCIGQAKKMGFTAIEFVDVIPPHNLSRPDYARLIREEAERQGLPVICYAVGADFLRCSDLAREIDRVQQEVELARLLGAPLMRHDVSQGYPQSSSHLLSFADSLPVLTKACRELADYANQFGLATMVENHGQFVQHSQKIETLVKAVNRENFGVLCDMGNFLDVDEEPTAACSRLAPYTFHLHAKDFHWKGGQSPFPGQGFFPTASRNWIRGAIIGHGDVPVQQCLAILRNFGYKGDLTIEFEGLEEPEIGVSISLKNLLYYLDELERQADFFPR